MDLPINKKTKNSKPTANIIFSTDDVQMNDVEEEIGAINTTRELTLQIHYHLKKETFNIKMGNVFATFAGRILQA